MIAKDLADQIENMSQVLATQIIPIKVQIGSRFYELEDTVALNIEERALVVRVKRKAKKGEKAPHMSDD